MKKILKSTAAVFAACVMAVQSVQIAAAAQEYATITVKTDDGDVVYYYTCDSQGKYYVYDSDGNLITVCYSEYECVEYVVLINKVNKIAESDSQNDSYYNDNGTIEQEQNDYYSYSDNGNNGNNSDNSGNSKNSDSDEITYPIYSENKNLSVYNVTANSVAVGTDSAVSQMYSGTNGYDIYRYDKSSGKWSYVFGQKFPTYKNYGSHDFALRAWQDTYNDTGLKTNTKYTYKIKYYKITGGKKKNVLSEKLSVKTKAPTPDADIKVNSKQVTVSWKMAGDWDGYEIYKYTLSPGEKIKLKTDNNNYSSDYWSWGSFSYSSYGYGLYDSCNYKMLQDEQGYISSSIYECDKDCFKHCCDINDNKKNKASFSVKSGYVYIYKVRAYKYKNGKKVYSDFSRQVTTDSTSAIINGVTLKPKTIVGAKDTALIKKHLAKCISSNMTQAQKAAAIYNYVHNIGHYETDYSKYSSDAIYDLLEGKFGQCYQYALTYQAMMQYVGFDVKLVHGKTPSGNPHWWNEITINGTTYLIDSHVGERFFIDGSNFVKDDKQ